MALADVIARVVAEVKGVSGVGTVHDRMRVIRTEADEKNFLDAGGRLNVWLVTRTGNVLADLSVNQSVTEQKDVICIHAFYAVKDADDSEAAFNAIVDAVVSAVNADRRPPSKLNKTVQKAWPPSVKTIDLRHYGATQTLCHHAEIEMPVVWRLPV